MKKLLFILFFTNLFLFSFFPVSGEEDTFFNIKTGEVIFKERSIMNKDIFAFTSLNKEWHPPSWMWDAGAYLAHRYFGWNGLLAARVVVIFLTFMALAAAAPPSLITPLTLSVTLLLSFFRFSDRPHMMGFLFLALLLYILYLNDNGKKRAALLLPPMFALWTNIHQSFILGIVIVGFYIFSRYVLSPKMAARSYPAFFCILLSPFFVLLNPAPAALLKGTIITLSMPLKEDIGEWLSPFFQPEILSFHFLFYVGYLAVVLFLLTYEIFSKRKQADVFLILITIFTAALSMRQQRDIATFAVCSFPLFAKTAAEIVKPLMKKKLFIFLLPLPLILILALQSSSFFYRDAGILRNIGPGLESYLLPAGAADFIVKNRIPGNMYNAYNFGGYLIWRLYPEYRVFIDGRNVDLESFHEYSWVILGLMSKDFIPERQCWNILKKHDINFILIDYPKPQIMKDATSAIYGYLYRFAADEWALVYFDDISMLWVKNDSKNRGLIEKYGYRILNPIFVYGQLDNIIRSGAVSALLSEVEKALAMNKTSWKINYIAGYIQLKLGNKEAAKKYFETALKLAPVKEPLLKILKKLV